MNALLVEDCRHALQSGVGLLLQSSLLLVLGLAAGWLLRRRGPALRAFLCQMTLAGVALGAVLAVALAGRVQPMWAVRLPTPALGTPSARLGSPPLHPAVHPAPPALGRGAEALRAGARSGEETSTLAPPTIHSPPPRPLPVEPRHRLQSPPRSGEVASLGETEGFRAPQASPYPLLAALWATVSGLLLLWLGACQWHLTRLRQRAQPITEGRAAETLARLAAPLAVRPPRLLQSPHVRSPFLAGVLRPAIFLPASWKADFDDATLRAVLAHELAHLTRRDCAWTLLLRLTTALLWPQPLLWLLARQLDQATEEACDVSALTPDCPPRRYADCLLRLADRALPGPAARTLGAGVVPIRSTLGRRIQALLDRRNQTMTPISTRLRVFATLGTVAVAAGLSVAFASSQDGPISKQTSSSPGSASARAEATQGGLSNADGGEKHFRYGILWGPFPKHMRHHWTGYFLSAVKGSPAARAGIPTWPQSGLGSRLVAINGHSAKGSHSVVAALFQLPPPLRITFLDPAGRTHQVAVQARETYFVPTSEASEKAHKAMLKSMHDKEQAELVIAKAALVRSDQALDEELHSAMPNADASTFKKARNIETWIGAYGMNIQAARGDAATWSTRQNPTSQAEARRFIAGREALQAPYLKQEARLFPVTANTKQLQAQVHKLAVEREFRNSAVIVLQDEMYALDLVNRMHKHGNG